MKTQPTRDAIQALRAIYKKLYAGGDLVTALRKLNPADPIESTACKSLIESINSNLNMFDNLEVVEAGFGIDDIINDYDEDGSPKLKRYSQPTI